MNDAIKMFKEKGPDVCEVYSQPRVVAEAGMRRFGQTQLKPGWSLDLTQVDPEDGLPWGLSDRKKVRKLWRLVKDGKPYCLICSPPCTMYCPLQAWNKSKFSAEEWEKKLQQARKHLQLCLELCKYQRSQNRFFIFEHPASAKSWQLPELKELKSLDGAYAVEFDMCRFGMVAKDDDGVVRPVQKETRMITNSWEVARRLNMKCPNRKQAGKPHEKHQHTKLLGGKAKHCQVYPKELCRALCAGIAAQKRAERLRAVGMPIMSLEQMQEIAGEACTKELNAVGLSGKQDFVQSDEGEGSEKNPSEALHEKLDGWWATDDVNGEALDPEKVMAARREELAYFRSMGVYKKVPLSEAAAAGQKTIAVRWIDINKGDRETPVYRSRLVAKEFRRGAQQEPELFAPTPPTECLKMCLSKLATRGRDYKLLYLDVSRAFFYARAERPVFVKLPQEDALGGYCAKLYQCMSGPRDAAARWVECYFKALE